MHFEPLDGQPWLPGAAYKLKWSHGVNGVTVDLELFKGGVYKFVAATGIASTDLQHTWWVPAGLESGEDYSFVMVATTGETVESAQLAIGGIADDDEPHTHVHVESASVESNGVAIAIGASTLAIITFFWFRKRREKTQHSHHRSSCCCSCCCWFCFAQKVASSDWYDGFHNFPYGVDCRQDDPTRSQNGNELAMPVATELRDGVVEIAIPSMAVVPPASSPTSAITAAPYETRDAWK